MLKKLFQFSLLIGLSVALSSCATAPGQRGPAQGEVYLKELCEHNNIVLEWDSVSQVVTLRFNDVKAKSLMGSNLVLIGDERIILSQSLRNERSAIIVPLDFKSRVIDRMRQTTSTSAGGVMRSMDYSIRHVREIIIDAGHGGKDPGAIGKMGTREKDVVLDIAKRLKRILYRHGVKVKMTREKDVFISLEERSAIASRSKADLFVSVHANASTVRTLQGMEVYSLRDLADSDKNEAQRVANEDSMFNRLTMKKRDEDLKDILCDMLYNYKQGESEDFARDVVNKTSRFLRTKNLGNKHARFFVLRNTLIPAILVEVGFLSNSKEESLLKTSIYRQKIAQGLARSILDYVRVP